MSASSNANATPTPPRPSVPISTPDDALLATSLSAKTSTFPDDAETITSDDSVTVEVVSVLEIAIDPPIALGSTWPSPPSSPSAFASVDVSTSAVVFASDVIATLPPIEVIFVAPATFTIAELVAWL